MSAADKLAQVLAEHQSFTHAVERNVWVTRCECYEELPTPGIEYAYDALAAHQAAVVLAHLTAEGWAKTEPIWSDGLENDGVHEFSDAYDCDGTFIRRWKRTPERRAKYSAWEADHA